MRGPPIASSSGWPTHRAGPRRSGPRPFEFRYQYLAGGVNTGNGWSTWNTNGQFVTWYVEDSADHGIAPVFPYYMLLQSNPASGGDE